METENEIYPGGFYGLLRAHEKKQRPFDDVQSALPIVDVEFGLLKAKQVVAPEQMPEDLPKYGIAAKAAQLQLEHVGKSELLLLHALLIAILRRRDPPADATSLFLRLWREEGQYLAAELDIRWKISAATTFADHGETGDQRALGMGLSILFDMIKIHESERRLSGQSGRKPFKRNRAERLPSLAFGMRSYSFKRGDLDRNMLARLWALSEQDTVINPLARAMLREVMQERRSIFGRLQRLKPQRPSKTFLKQFFEL